MRKQNEDVGSIMHGLSKTSVVPDEQVFENMPSFPRISRSKGLTFLLVNRVKSWFQQDQTVYFLTEAVYVQEKYAYRYFDYRHVFVNRDNTSTITLALEFTGPKTLRLRMQEGFTVQEHSTEMISSMKREPVSFTTTETENEILIQSPEITARITKNPWNLELSDEAGHVFYRQFGRDTHSFMPYEICPLGYLYDAQGEQYACESICKTSYEKYYGSGENFTAVDRTGRAFELWNTNSLGVNTERAYKYIPFFISSQGYGVFCNTSRKTRFDLAATLSKAANLMVAEDILDLFIMKGSTIRDILPLYYDLTGWPAMPPKWSFGLWISKISYGTRKEVETVTRRLRQEDIPCDVIHIDTDWFAENWICDWKFDAQKFPHVEEMISELHQNGFHLSLWQLPYIERGAISTEVYDEAMQKGYFASNPDGDLQFAHGLIDLTNPEAVTWYKEKLIKPLLRQGIDVIKVDFGESAPPFFKYAGKDGRDMHNLYALLYNKTIYEATVEELGADNALIWARSAWAGSQKYPVHWGGDSGTDFGSMESSLKGCLNASISGIPFWSSDIGGFFFDGGPTLYIRWSQFGMFCSHARLHGYYTREPWDYGEEALEIFRKYVKIRYRLIPYIYNSALKTVKTGELMHRAMVYEFPEDLTARSLDTQYLFGHDLLVAPVLNPEGHVEVYLPAGLWTDWHTGEVLQGPCWVKKEVSLDIMPLYIRENAILPMQEDMNYIGEKEPELYEVSLYPGTGINRFDFYEEGAVITMDSSAECTTVTVTPMKKALRLIFHGRTANKITVNAQRIDHSFACGQTTVLLTKELLQETVTVIMK